MATSSEPPDGEEPSEKAEISFTYGETDVSVAATSSTAEGVQRTTKIAIAGALALTSVIGFVVLSLNDKQTAAYVVLSVGVLACVAMLFIKPRK